MSRHSDRGKTDSAGSRLLAAALFLLAGAALLSDPAPSWSEPANRGPVVVIDPGHGGDDMGAKQPGGGYEKDLVLYLANSIAARLGSGYTAVLTREGDYALDLDARSGVANHLKADLFVCLHAQGEPRPLDYEVRLFYYHHAGGGSSTDGATAGGDWETRQSRHLEASRAFAQEVEKQLYARLPGITVRIENLPLAVLAGADMPALLIEAGGLSFYDGGNPETPSRQAEAFVASVAEAIGAFLVSR